MPAKINKNTALRDRILRERGLVTTKGKALVKGAPVSEITGSLARLVESHFASMTIRQILTHYSISEIARQTGVNRSTLHRWKNRLGMT